MNALSQAILTAIAAAVKTQIGQDPDAEAAQTLTGQYEAEAQTRLAEGATEETVIEEFNQLANPQNQ